MTMATFSAHPWAQPVEQRPGAAPDETYPNFDIRANKTSANEYLERVVDSRAILEAGGLASARISAIGRLQDSGKSIDLIESPLLGSIEVLSARPETGFLTGPSTDRAAAMRAFLIEYSGAYGLAQDQLDSLELVADYINPAGNMAWVEFEQRINGLPVFQGFVRGGFTASGELARTTGPLASGLSGASLATLPALGAASAVARSAASVGWQIFETSLVQKSSADGGTRLTFDRGVMADDAKAWLLYFPLAPGVARLAWAAEIWGDPNVFLVVTDAEDGTLLFRKNLTNYQTQSATYVVYNNDSPAPLSPTTALPGTNTQAPFIARTTHTLIGNEPPNTFNNLGWMTDNTNGVNGHTDGNNVEAGMDLDGTTPINNGVDAPVPGVNRVFNFAYDPEVQDPGVAGYQSGEAAQMFYWTNTFHDRTYLLGFTEPARNFQHDNFGRGGLGLDRVSAEGQDASGINNANFSTPADGGRGRMQMYRFTFPTPDRSSGLDMDVLLHELTHGLSNRLHGNGAGLSINMSRGMGEGWSDFYARALLSTAGEDPNAVYAMGGWVTHLLGGSFTDNYYYGIRRFPHAVKTNIGGPGNLPHNPLTFADIDATQINLTDGAYPPAFAGTADHVHNMGEVWCAALLEVRARFITRLGFAVGNQRILQFVTDGMKLDPLGPTMLQARDAILAAANAGGGTAADIADIWAGFATRGMGVLASIPNIGPYGAGNGSTRVVENFNVPTDPGLPSFSINDVSVAEGNAGTSTATFTVSLANGGGVERRVKFNTSDNTAGSGTFVSAAPVLIPGSGTGIAPGGSPGSPYPATVNVSGLGTVTRVRVLLRGVRHSYPADMDMLLVGPTGARIMLLSDVGSQTPMGSPNPLAGIDLMLDDGAPAMTGAQLVTGTYAPTDGAFDGGVVGETLPAPAPGPPYSTSFAAAFNGTNPNGTWSLYTSDDSQFDPGSIDGFSVIVSTTTNDYVATFGELVFSAGTTSLPVNVTINGDVVAEPDESFFVNLFGPIGAVIGDGQGQGTILNDEGGGLAPTTVNDNYSTPFNTQLVVAAPGVLTNDNTNGGGAMTAALVTNVSNGTLVLSPDGSLTYTPNAGFSGNDSFTYRAVNSVGPGNTATVTITVTAGGSVPTAVNDAYATAFNTQLVVAAPGVLGNDNSNGGGAMTAGLNTNVANGVLALNPNGGFTYTPNSGFIGNDSFTYRATNSVGPSNVATVTITVQAAAAPTTVNDAYSTPFETTLLVPVPGVLINDNTNGGGAMTAQLVSNVTNGTLALGGTGGFTYTPNAGFAGTDTFTYQAVNGVGPGNVATVTITVNEPTTVQPPKGLYAASIVGNTVTLRWTPEPLGPDATGFVLEGGINPGEVLASLPTGSPYPIFTFTAPTGAFYVRVHALEGVDRSGASNEIRIFVNVPQAPSAPADLVGLVNGSTIGLAWRNTFGGGAPTSVTLDVTGSIIGSIPLGLVDSFNFAGVPGGTYTLSVRASNASGGSGPSNAVTLSFPGPCSGPPLASGNFLAYKIGNTIYVVWDPAPTGPATTSFVLNVTGTFAGNFPTTARAISGSVPPGTYNLSLTSVNSCGSATTAVQTVVVP